jgi:hypothetical protein
MHEHAHFLQPSVGCQMVDLVWPITFPSSSFPCYSSALDSEKQKNCALADMSTTSQKLYGLA